MPEHSLEQKAGENFFGDVVVYETNTIYGTLVGWFTRSVFNHCALRTSEYGAESSDLTEWFSEKNFLKHNLKEPEEYVISYKILRHVDATPEKREKMKEFYQQVAKEYDLLRILRLAKIHLGRRAKRDLSRDIATKDDDVLYYWSTKVLERFGYKLKSGENNIALTPYLGGFNKNHCPSTIQLVHGAVGIDYKINGSRIHPSQLEPHYFLEIPGFEIIDEIKFQNKEHRIWSREILGKKIFRIGSAHRKAVVKTIRGVSSFFEHKP